MGKEYTLVHGLEEFATAREQFSYLVNRLQSEERGRMEHGEVEATIAQEGITRLKNKLAACIVVLTLLPR